MQKILPLALLFLFTTLFQFTSVADLTPPYITANTSKKLQSHACINHNSRTPLSELQGVHVQQPDVSTTCTSILTVSNSTNHLVHCKIDGNLFQIYFNRNTETGLVTIAYYAASSTYPRNVDFPQQEFSGISNLYSPDFFVPEPYRFSTLQQHHKFFRQYPRNQNAMVFT